MSNTDNSKIIGTSTSNNTRTKRKSITIENSKIGTDLDVIKISYNGATITISYFGGTLLSYINKDGEEKLFKSEKMITDKSKAVRGGVPIVFPQFGKSGPLVQHGFARTAMWEITKDPEVIDGDNVNVVFSLIQSKEIKNIWPLQEFTLDHSITFGSNNLETSISVINNGKEEFEFQTLLHTYYSLEDISDVRIEGLKSLEYKDQLQDGKVFVEESEVKTIEKETDSIYKNGKKIIVACKNKTIEIKVELKQENENKPCDVVLWNPWIDKSKAMGDFGDEEYHNMICVEPGLVSRYEKCFPNRKWSLTQTVTFS